MTKVERLKVWIGEAASWSRLKSAARAAGFVLGVVMLALLGSGRMARWLSPKGDLGIQVAEAAPLPSVASAEPPSLKKAAPVAAAASDTAVVEVPGLTIHGSAGAGDTVEAPEAGDAGAASPGVAADGKVILNLATEEDLRRLPGIGHGRAQSILALREKLKKFSRVEDLLKVKGIGRRGLARIRPLVRVD